MRCSAARVAPTDGRNPNNARGFSSETRRWFTDYQTDRQTRLSFCCLGWRVGGYMHPSVRTVTIPWPPSFEKPSILFFFSLSTQLPVCPLLPTTHGHHHRPDLAACLWMDPRPQPLPGEGMVIEETVCDSNSGTSVTKNLARTHARPIRHLDPCLLGS